MVLGGSRCFFFNMIDEKKDSCGYLTVSCDMS